MYCKWKGMWQRCAVVKCFHSRGRFVWLLASPWIYFKRIFLPCYPHTLWIRSSLSIYIVNHIQFNNTTKFKIKSNILCHIFIWCVNIVTNVSKLSLQCTCRQCFELLPSKTYMLLTALGGMQLWECRLRSWSLCSNRSGFIFTATIWAV